jgi:hypothetical protein
MSRTSAEALLALFATRDLATSIVGDLTEESRGRTWFWTQVFGTALALCFKSIVAAPLRSLGFTLVGLIIYGGIYAALMTVSGLWWYPWNRVGDLDFWLRVVSVVTLTNLATGIVVGRWVWSDGMSGLAPLTALWLAVWVFWVLRLFVDAWWWSWALATVVAFPFFCLSPLLLGGALGRRLTTRTLALRSSDRGPSSPRR